MIKTSKSHDRPYARKGSGACPQLTNSDGRRPNALQNNVPRYDVLKPSKESHTPPRHRGLHPAGALARIHRKATTLQPQFMTRSSLCESGHTRAKARGLLSGT
jgi:hypothetical protein